MTRRASPIEVNGRVEYRSEDVIEWYEERANGIEQGFTFTKRPSNKGALVVDVVLADDTIATASTADTIDLKRASDAGPTFRYGALSAIDATKRVLPSRLSVQSSHTIRIEVDDTSATYPITIDPLIWALQQKLTRLEVPAGSRFGSAVALSGDTLIAAMAGYQTSVGSFFVYRRTSAGWIEEAFVPAPYYDIGYFGINAKLEGDRAMIAARATGMFYTRTGKTWMQEQALPSVPRYLFAGPFGAQIALRGDTAAVTHTTYPVPYADGGTAGPGTVFVYTRTNGEWKESAVLSSPEPISNVLGEIALDGDTLALGTGAHVAVFRRTGSTWSLEGMLAGDQELQFGHSIAFRGNTLLAGNPAEHAAYVFERSNGAWSRKQKLEPPSAPKGDDFGFRLVSTDNEALIAAPSRPPGGSVFRFTKAADGWKLNEEISPDGGSALSAFGISLASDENRAAFGAFGESTLRGAVYVYERRNAVGDACTIHDSCATGFCVDGVCCDSACGGGDPNDCLRCDAPPKKGSCSIAESGFVCRPAAGECDLLERCNGTNAMCPHDAVLANGTTCTNGACAAGACVPHAPTPAPISAAPTNVSASGGGCSLAGAPSRTHSSAFFVIGIVLFVLRRRLAAAALLASGIACSSIPNEPPEKIETTREALVWGEKQKLVPPTALPAGGFGAVIGVSNTTLAVARPNPNAEVGSVHVFVRSGNEWKPEAQLTANETVGGQFGGALAIDGDTLAIGAPDSGIAGAVYIFERANGSWTQQAKLVPPDPSAPGHDNFGYGVALSGDLLVVGAPAHALDEATGETFGAMYVYRRTNGSFVQEEKVAALPFARNLGVSVAVDGNRIIAGATPRTINRPLVAPDLAIIAARVNGVWELEHVAIVDNQRTSFGASVALAGDTAIIGAPQGGGLVLPPPGGAAYVLRRVNGVWSTSQKLQPPTGEFLDFFGVTTSLRGDRVLIGAARGNKGKGAAYLYARAGELWQLEETFQASDGGPDHLFGAAVASSEDMLVVGAPGHSKATGAAYAIYRGLLGEPCTTSESCATGFCVDGFCCDGACGNSDPNDCRACSVVTGATQDGRCTTVNGRVCRAARNECDVAEACDGEQAACPIDTVAKNGLVCGGGKGSCSAGVCLDSLPVPDAVVPPAQAQPAPAASDGCNLHGAPSADSFAALGLVLFALIARRRRRR